ncbi:fatty acid desaturase [Aerophototrophica crusticola]|uniref:fatty acid desaturase n=1 Tax=Aerophototrophica crusticola TaxID=1709002 RepID=UPI00384DB148
MNYVEHYGLERRPTRPGAYEPVRPRHSWDSAHRLTNWTLFNLGLHADHHTHAGKASPSCSRNRRVRRCPPAIPAWSCWPWCRPSGTG